MTNPTTEVLIDLRERMVRIETKLDAHAENRTTDRHCLDDHEDRLVKLEGQSRLMIAMGSIVLFLVTFFQTSIQKFLGA